MEVSGKRHAAAAFLPGKNVGAKWVGCWVGCVRVNNQVVRELQRGRRCYRLNFLSKPQDPAEENLGNAALEKTILN
jgi:hypothetical protein